VSREYLTAGNVASKLIRYSNAEERVSTPRNEHAVGVFDSTVKEERDCDGLVSIPIEGMLVLSSSVPRVPVGHGMVVAKQTSSTLLEIVCCSRKHMLLNHAPS
jgi:hypothetical protein